MPQTQGAGVVFTGGPGSKFRGPLYIQSAKATGGVYTYTQVVDANGFITGSSVDNLTALAGGGQAGATPITAQVARFTTVVTAGDSSLLPVSEAGLEITVINAGAASMNVFPQTGDKINALGANAAFAVAAGKTCSFFCATAGQWHSILSA